MLQQSSANESRDNDQSTRFRMIDEALEKAQLQQDALIEILHTAQNACGYLSEESLDYIALRLKLPPSMVYGVATFYDFFTLAPRGEYICVVCLGTACYIKGAESLMTRIGNEFAINCDATSADGRLSLTSARCLGSCSLAPMMNLDEAALGPLTPDEAIVAIRNKLALQQTGKGDHEPD